MARASWALLHDRPVIQNVLTLAPGGQKTTRNLLADTGAGNAHSEFDLLLEEHDCVVCGAKAAQTVSLGGAYAGLFPRYSLRVEIPQLGFDGQLLAVGVPNPPRQLDGIACFRFLNRFTYGNFGNASEFGLES